MKKMIAYKPYNLILDKSQNLGCFVLGDSSSSVNVKCLEGYRIRTVISIGEETKPKKQYSSIAYHLIPLHDKKTESLITHLQPVCQLIHQNRSQGGVLIHCQHGVSRSASFVIAYLMLLQNMSLEEAKAYVSSKRSCIGPNKGFIEQLGIFQEQKLPLKNDVKK